MTFNKVIEKALTWLGNDRGCFIFKIADGYKIRCYSAFNVIEYIEADDDITRFLLANQKRITSSYNSFCDFMIRLAEKEWFASIASDVRAKEKFYANFYDSVLSYMLLKEYSGWGNQDIYKRSVLEFFKHNSIYLEQEITDCIADSLSPVQTLIDLCTVGLVNRREYIKIGGFCPIYDTSKTDFALRTIRDNYYERVKINVKS